MGRSAIVTGAGNGKGQETAQRLTRRVASALLADQDHVEIERPESTIGIEAPGSAPSRTLQMNANEFDRLVKINQSEHFPSADVLPEDCLDESEAGPSGHREYCVSQCASGRIRIWWRM